MLRTITFLTALAAALVGLGAAANNLPPEAAAQTPNTNEKGLLHVVEVVDGQGRPVPDGTVIKFLNADLRPPANDEELQEAKERGYCAEATVTGGRAEITPEFAKDHCREGTRIAAFVFASAQTDMGVAVHLEPAVEWRMARADETSRSVTARPILPSTGAEDQTSTIQPPDTGSASNAPVRDSNVRKDWAYIAFGIAVILGLMSVGVAILQRSARHTLSR